MESGRSLFAVLLGVLVLVTRGRAAYAQAAADAALKDRVLQLVERLDADKVEARDTATASLIKLGPENLAALAGPRHRHQRRTQGAARQVSARLWRPSKTS